VATPADSHNRGLARQTRLRHPAATGEFKQAERVAAATPGLTAPGLWSEAPTALDIPETEDGALDDLDEEAK
jgi:hypothetical protein